MAFLATAVPSVQLPWLICGALGGYLLLLFTNPVRASLRDGLRCLRRYPTLWVALGVVGFAGALFQLGLRVYYFSALPVEEKPAFVWLRAAWQDPQLWLHGSKESLWYLPPHALREAAFASPLPALESVAGLFNCAISTFPLASLAALLLLVNWQGHHAVLLRALRKRFRGFGWLVYAGVLVCALAALAKPLLYVAPQLIVASGGAPAAKLLWIQWGPVAEWLASLFEYLFGVGLQTYLILLAFTWVRGLTFTRAHLLDFAIRRGSFVLQWALVVMLLSSAFINVPLILKNFPALQTWFPDDAVLLEGRLRLARALLTGLLLLFSTVQITLVFHSETLRQALRQHGRFLARFAWPLGWFLILAALHCYLFHVAQELVLRGLGEETAAGLVWALGVPWLRALLTAWLLAAWVCLFKRCETGEAERVQF